MTTLRLQNAYYTVRDISRARAFYEEVLQLKLKFQDGARWAQFDVGGANFSLSSVDESAVRAGGEAVIVFEVDSLDDARSRILQVRGSVVAERDMGTHGRTLTFRDIDDNVIQLFQRTAGAVIA
jgi:predicted enzyme related to lactoylglutathione lyase